MRFLSLIRRLVLRTIRRERILTILSIGGVALGIGLFVGVKVAADRAVEAFTAEIRGIGGQMNYEILHASGIDFDEGIYPAVRLIEEESLPVLVATAFIQDLRETVEIIAPASVRAIGLLSAPSLESEALGDLFRVSNGVLVTKRFSERHGTRKGDELRALVYDREHLLRVVGVLDDAALTPSAMVMDLGNFQDLSGKAGFLSRIELRTDEVKAEKIRKILSADLSIERKDDLIKSREEILKSFRYNLQFVSLIAILVGMFLLYNTVFMSVVKRRTEIGILRGLGMARRTVILLFLTHGLILGLSGSILGIAIGQGAAYFSSLAVEKTISAMYETISISDYRIAPSDAGMAVLIGIAVSLAASAVPAYESSRIRPNESMREGTFESAYRGYRGILAAAGLIFVSAGCLLAVYDYHLMPFSFPFPSYVGILLIIAGFSLLSPAYLSLLLRVLKRPAEGLFRATARIALSDMRGNTYRFSVALMSVAISSALIIALFTLISSFRGSLKGWIEENIAADIYIKPSSCASNFCFFPLSEEVVRIAGEVPEVEGMNQFRTIQVDLFGRKVTAGFADTVMDERFARKRGGKMVERTAGLRDAPRVSISRYLSARYGLQEGDLLEILTPSGPVAFTVADVFSSYSTTSGFLFFDRRWLKEFWGLDDATQLSIYLREGADAVAVARDLRRRLSERFSLQVLNNRDLRQSVLEIFDRSFAITYAIEVISIIVSLIGVVNILMAFVLERRRDISVLRYLGGTWRQIQEVLVVSAAVVGAGGIILGACMGLMMSLIFVFVVNKVSFGWEITFGIPFAALAVVAAGLFVSTVLAGLLPARAARRVDPRQFISFE